MRIECVSIAVVLLVLATGCQTAPHTADETESREPTVSQEIYFPPTDSNWETISPEDAGWDPERLQNVLDYAGGQRSSGVVVAYKGRIMAEQYWNLTPDSKTAYSAMKFGTDAAGHSIEDVASIQKSVAAVLAVMGREHGLLDLDVPASQYLSEGWSKAKPEDEAAITVRHLMAMASGLNEQLEFEAPAGTKWNYNTRAYTRVYEIVSHVAGTELNATTREWLTSRIGMNDSRWVNRPVPPGRKSPDNLLGFATTARDLARLGILVLAEGKWGPQQIVKKESLDELFAVAQEMNPSYRLLWGANGTTMHMRPHNSKVFDGPLFPSAPPDLLAAMGSLGRKLYIVPSLGLVVTRLGDQYPDKRFDHTIWTKLMQAAPDARTSMHGVENETSADQPRS